MSTALRSPLRRPAAAALLACGVIHSADGLRRCAVRRLRGRGLPRRHHVLSGVRTPARGGRLGADPGAATAVGIIAAHTLSGPGTVDLLRSSLSADFAWAGLAAPGCAAVALVLAGTVLTPRQKTAQTAERKAPGRSSAARGVTNDA
ncbi:hypothetical protein [Streptomyces niveus]|uniref:hypothetical protein n=1 Tax=Streptomyces niveus TaxID=193462 RepID=UPI0036D3C25A